MGVGASVAAVMLLVMCISVWVCVGMWVSARVYVCLRGGGCGYVCECG